MRETSVGGASKDFGDRTSQGGCLWEKHLREEVREGTSEEGPQRRASEGGTLREGHQREDI